MQRNSDMDYRERMCWPSEAEIAARMDDEARTQRWSDFVEFLQAHYGDGWPDAAYAVFRASQPDVEGASFDVIRQFASEESWASVYAAIARAMR